MFKTLFLAIFLVISNGSAFAQIGPSPQMQELRAQLTEAFKAHDQAKIKEISAQMKSLRQQLHIAFLKAHPDIAAIVQQILQLQDQLKVANKAHDKAKVKEIRAQIIALFSERQEVISKDFPQYAQERDKLKTLQQQMQLLHLQLLTAVKSNDQTKVAVIKTQITALRQQLMAVFGQLSP
jgi:hypothetical protein